MEPALLWRNDRQAHVIDTSSPSWRAGAGVDLHNLFPHWLFSCVLLFRCLPGPRSLPSSAGPDDILDALFNMQIRTCDSLAWFSTTDEPRVGCSRSIPLLRGESLALFVHIHLSFSPSFLPRFLPVWLHVLSFCTLHLPSLPFSLRHSLSWAPCMQATETDSVGLGPISSSPGSVSHSLGQIPSLPPH